MQTAPKKTILRHCTCVRLYRGADMQNGCSLQHLETTAASMGRLTMP